MIINLKKLTLGIMTTGGLLVPISVMASCSSSDVVNYEISAKSNPKLLREEIQGNKYQELSTLEKIFTGLDDNKLKNLNIKLESINEENTIYKITLTAKSGFTINDGTTITSQEFTLETNLIIRALGVENNPPLAAWPIDINDFAEDNYKSLATLRKLFLLDDRITDQTTLDEMVNITKSEGNTNTITLSAKNDFSINNVQSIISKEFEMPTNILIEAQNNIPNDIIMSDIAGNNFMNFSVLQKLFVGADFNSNNLANMEVVRITVVQGSKYKIELKSKPGYNINGSSEAISSGEFNVLAFNINAQINELPAWTLTFNDLDGDNWKQLETIKKLFTFNLEIDSQEKLDEMFDISITSNTIKSITLNTKPGFTINGGETLTSNQFEIPVNYIIEIVEDPSIFIIRLSQIVNQGYKNLSLISKLFMGTGISDASLLNMNIELITHVPDLTYQIKLTPKDGFNINGLKQEIISEELTVKFIEETIEHSFQPLPSNLTLSEIQDLDKIKTKEFLSQFFVLNDLRDQAWIDRTLIVTWNMVVGTTDQYEITLTATSIDIKLNGEETFASKPFEVITPLEMGNLIQNPGPVTVADLNATNLSTVQTLSKLFDLGSIEQNNITNNLTVSVTNNTAGSNAIVTLTANKGYKFLFPDGQYTDSISSVEFVVAA
ncbi:MAG: hypothetical protein ACRDCH_02695 [Metamycoplasmataceae bacterium]